MKIRWPFFIQGKGHIVFHGQVISLLADQCHALAEAYLGEIEPDTPIEVVTERIRTVTDFKRLTTTPIAAPSEEPGDPLS